jgi:hypothetical protein
MDLGLELSPAAADAMERAVAEVVELLEAWGSPPRQRPAGPGQTPASDRGTAVCPCPSA